MCKACANIDCALVILQAGSFILQLFSFSFLHSGHNCCCVFAFLFLCLNRCVLVVGAVLCDEVCDQM